jgi:hypothetical protein
VRSFGRSARGDFYESARGCSYGRDAAVFIFCTKVMHLLDLVKWGSNKKIHRVPCGVYSGSSASLGKILAKVKFSTVVSTRELFRPPMRQSGAVIWYNHVG